MAHFLIAEARFYTDLADELAAGAIEALEAAGNTYARISVPGALELPAALLMAHQGTQTFDGYIALGVVIRGETTHYEIVTEESARGLMNLSLDPGLAIGNGIQTVENSEQAWARARRTEKNKGAGAAEAAMAMVGLRTSLGAR